MQTLYIHKVKDTKTGKSWELLANTPEHAKNIIARTFTHINLDDLIASALTTIEGYGVTWLRALPKGAYFRKVRAKNMSTHMTTYVKAEYDRHSKGYDCYKFYDVCDTCCLSGDLLVTIDATF